MTQPHFQENSIAWIRFGDIEPAIHYRIMHLDASSRIADVMFKFPAQQQIVLHRHHAPNHTFVVQGEHRLYEPDGSLREVRATGSYTVSPASEQPHREGGGAHDVVVLFSIRPGEADMLYELLDDALQPIGAITFTLLAALYQAQQDSLKSDPA